MFPAGYQVYTCNAKIKDWHRDDVCLIISDLEAVVCGVTTANRVAAAPIIAARKILRSGKASAIIVNAGNANAYTGAIGNDDVSAIQKAVAGRLNLSAQKIIPASTGIIGVRLPADKIVDKVNHLPMDNKPATKKNWDFAARSIMTTDLQPKQKWVELKAQGKVYSLGGIAKGSGMIHPNMATMLAFVFTDAMIAKKELDQMVADITERTFNQISVDRETSTNDICVVMANGAAGLEITSAGDLQNFKTALEGIFTHLAKSIAADGEGATCMLEVVVEGAHTDADARQAARAIVASNLVKTAAYGKDPNWGRIIAALGASGIKFDPDILSLNIGNVVLVDHGRIMWPPVRALEKAMKRKEVRITVNLHDKDGVGTAWGCDLSPEYVKINAEYST